MDELSVGFVPFGRQAEGYQELDWKKMHGPEPRPEATGAGSTWEEPPKPEPIRVEPVRSSETVEKKDHLMTRLDRTINFERDAREKQTQLLQDIDEPEWPGLGTGYHADYGDSALGVLMNAAFTNDLFALAKLPGAIFNPPPAKVRTYWDQIDQDARAEWAQYASEHWAGSALLGPNDTMMKLSQKLMMVDPLMPREEAEKHSWWDIAKKPKVWGKVAAEVLLKQLSNANPYYFSDAIDDAIGAPGGIFDGDFNAVIANDPDPQAAAFFINGRINRQRVLSREPDAVGASDPLPLRSVRRRRMFSPREPSPGNFLKREHSESPEYRLGSEPIDFSPSQMSRSMSQDVLSQAIEGPLRHDPFFDGPPRELSEFSAPPQFQPAAGSMPALSRSQSALRLRGGAASDSYERWLHGEDQLDPSVTPER